MRVHSHLAIPLHQTGERFVVKAKEVAHLLRPVCNAESVVELEQSHLQTLESLHALVSSSLVCHAFLYIFAVVEALYFDMSGVAVEPLVFDLTFRDIVLEGVVFLD